METVNITEVTFDEESSFVLHLHANLIGSDMWYYYLEL